MRLAVILCGLHFSALPAAAETVVAGLSQDRVSITANFDGSDILIYGAVKREEPIPRSSRLDVIVTVEGPSAPITVRRKSRAFGVWINTASVMVDSAPSFYEVATTAPLTEILSATEDLRHSISVAQAIRSVGAPQDVLDSPAFTEALIRIRDRSGAYRQDDRGVRLAEETLFRADIDLPANLIEGDYKARIFLVREKRIVAELTDTIGVRKVGLERFLFTLARDRPVAYGLLALAIAALAGWSASTVFRYARS
ncbi:MAG: TIGR02186 family protein [Paracoccaceae bacterium]